MGAESSFIVASVTSLEASDAGPVVPPHAMASAAPTIIPFRAARRRFRGRGAATFAPQNGHDSPRANREQPVQSPSLT